MLHVSARADAALGQANAPVQSHWSFQKPSEPAVPDVRDGAWPRSEVDRFLLAKLEAAGLAPFGQADKRTLIRRATYDLTGLPPTPAEVDAFLDDPSPRAFAHVVERLLASERYGERWGRHWLDVVRYADTAGENTDMPVADAWRFRNYVIRAFNEDKPFDPFISEHLAGDILAKADPNISPEQYSELITATGYLVISRGHGHDAKKDHYLTIEDTIDTLVVWTTEFGRAPFNSSADHKGREHHNWAFTTFLAGAGVRAGHTHGATDEIGLKSVVDPVHTHDFHATILHLLGLNHERLTYFHDGRDFLLSAVSGQGVNGVLA